MLKKEKIRVSKSMGVHLFFLKFAGLWTPPKLTTIQKNIYEVFSISIVSVLIYVYLAAVLIYAIRETKSVDDIGDVYFHILLMINTVIKTLPFQLKITQIQKLVAKLDSDIFQPKKGKHCRIIEKEIKLTRYILIFFVVMYLCVTHSWFLVSTYYTIVTGARILPVEAWGFRHDTDFMFTIALVYQLVSHTYMSIILCCEDFFVLGMMINATAQLNILLDKFRNADEYFEEDESGENGMVYLKECVKHHQEIIR